MSTDQLGVDQGRVVYKDLCIDAVDAAAAARFWSPVLGLQVHDRHGNVMLGDGVPEHAVWVNAVPEEHTVKNRLHLDVHTAAVSDLEALGARVLDDSFRWTVMADPEGGEFCAFVREPGQLPDYRLYELVQDAADPEQLAGWWAERFGVEAQREGHEGESWWSFEGAPGMPWSMTFSAVPEPKATKNRVHVDVWGLTRSLLDAGATLLRARDDEIRWDMLADPEGNEFCVFAPE